MGEIKTAIYNKKMHRMDIINNLINDVEGKYEKIPQNVEDKEKDEIIKENMTAIEDRKQT